MVLTWNKPRTCTYFGRTARVRELRATRKRDGLRVVVLEWIDDADARNGGHPAGTITVRLIEGDGRYLGFCEHRAEILPVGTPVDDATNLAERMLAEQRA